LGAANLQTEAYGKTSHGGRERGSNPVDPENSKAGPRRGTGIKKGIIKQDRREAEKKIKKAIRSSEKKLEAQVDPASAPASH